MKQANTKLLIHIVGPTAIGKTAVAISLAKHYQTEIVSADSRQFYKELNIGTAKASALQRHAIPHHLIDFLSINDNYNVTDYQEEAINHINQLFTTKDVAIVTGGSGLYLHAIWYGFDGNIPGPNPDLRSKLDAGFKKKGLEFLQEELRKIDEEALDIVDLKNPMRLMRAIEISSDSGKSFASFRRKQGAKRPFKQLKIALTMDRRQLHDRINQRVDAMMQAGLLEEAKTLLPFRDKNALQTVGYRELFQYFDGDFSLEEAVEKIKTNTRRYAKRQMTWLRRYDDIIYIDTNDLDKIKTTIDQTLKDL